MQYTQDYDERYPLASQPAAPTSWTDIVQPYVKNFQIFRCPNDNSQNWTAPLPSPTFEQQGVRVSSYFMNLWIDGRRQYNSMASIQSPASVIYGSESNRQPDTGQLLSPILEPRRSSQHTGSNDDIHANHDV